MIDVRIATLIDCEYLFEDSENKENMEISDYRFVIDQDDTFENNEDDSIWDEDDYEFSSISELNEFIEKLVSSVGLEIDWIDDHRFNVSE